MVGDDIAERWQARSPMPMRFPYFRIGRTIRYSREQIDRALMDRHQCNAGALSS
jgi:hypothetical protein